MLTEVGTLTFTLPMCLRGAIDPGFPVGDTDVWEYLKGLPVDDDMSYRYVACLLGTAYSHMLLRLKTFKDERKNVLDTWHSYIENKTDEAGRREFFADVVVKARLAAQSVPTSDRSPKRKEGYSAIGDVAQKVYRDHVLNPLTELLTWIQNTGHIGLCVTYVDEAQKMGGLLRVMQRLISCQTLDSKMWFVFMSTKSNIDFFPPSIEDRQSLRTRLEVATVLPPFFALGFDQIITKSNQTVTSYTMGEISSLNHIAKYGRPLWAAHLAELKKLEYGDHELVILAAMKLLDDRPSALDLGDPDSSGNILSLLTQRLCIDTILCGKEAATLTKRTVSDHMRLLVGLSEDRRTFYPSSPSEPVLAVAAAFTLYTNPKFSLNKVLAGFEKHLCSAGLVDKGLLGELAARLLLLTARDHAALGDETEVLRLLNPVPLPTMLRHLFGAGNDLLKVGQFNQLLTEFAEVYVNFTHWVVTNGNLPEELDSDVLVNLWVRGTGLQCTFNQESIDLLFVTYQGPFEVTDPVDASKLSAVVLQIKFKNQADSTAAPNVRPVGIPTVWRSRSYLAMIMELGTETMFKATQTKLKVQVPSRSPDISFQDLLDEYVAAERAYAVALEAKVSRGQADALRAAYKEARSNLDNYNRYEIHVRGASPATYGILKAAGISETFDRLLRHANPLLPEMLVKIVQTMQPLACLPENLTGAMAAERSGHVAWMTKFSSVAQTPVDQTADMAVDQ
ncbi:hypothetical protein BDN72DRAFT_561208 [Pluteus cervinus]|uniref:Uncharacterized protein n=1 Tax=Pluteus cervinus TaxID=181527 RepID=A0ACD3BBZ4_9AGAR|nr:hypothetical protein BDN72DRAFT_561208 [Pluteus cervinus]